MILLALLLQANADVTFGEVRQLPPAAAGERLLKGEDHGQIEAFIAPAGGPGPPNFIQADLVEKPTTTIQGCTRKRWSVSFHAQPGERLDDAVADDHHQTTDIARPGKSGCSTATYVHLNPGIAISQGFAVLEALERLRSVRERFVIACTDTTQSDLCKDQAKIPSKLSILKPWNIATAPNGLAVWLGTPGSTVTELRFDQRQPDHVWINRSVPAPF